MILLLALAIGLCNGRARRLGVADLSTAVLTLSGLAADNRLAGGSNPDLARRLAAVVALFLGASLGAKLIATTGALVVPLMLAGGIVLIRTLAFATPPTLQNLQFSPL